MQGSQEGAACLLVGCVAMLPIIGVLSILGDVRGLGVCLGGCTLHSLGGAVNSLLGDSLSLLRRCLRAAYHLLLDSLQRYPIMRGLGSPRAGAGVEGVGTTDYGLARNLSMLTSHVLLPEPPCAMSAALQASENESYTISRLLTGT